MKTIHQYINDKIKVEHQQIFTNFRILIQEKFPFIKEEMRGGTEKFYGVPVYRHNRIIISVSPTQKGITFSFTNGKQFKDKYQLLEGVGNKSLNLRLTSVAEYKDEILAYYILQAIELDN